MNNLYGYKIEFWSALLPESYRNAEWDLWRNEDHKLGDEEHEEAIHNDEEKKTHDQFAARNLIVIEMKCQLFRIGINYKEQNGGYDQRKKDKFEEHCHCDVTLEDDKEQNNLEDQEEIRVTKLWHLLCLHRRKRHFPDQVIVIVSLLNKY